MADEVGESASDVAGQQASETAEQQSPSAAGASATPGEMSSLSLSVTPTLFHFSCSYFIIAKCRE